MSNIQRLTFAVLLLLGSIGIAACGDSEEPAVDAPTEQTATSIPVQSTAPGGGNLQPTPAFSGSVGGSTATGTPVLSTLVGPQQLFSIEYPSGWFVSPSPSPPAGIQSYSVSLYSFDPNAGGPMPVDGLKVDFEINSLSIVGNCFPPTGLPSSTASLDGEVASRSVNEATDATGNKAVYIKAIHAELCFTIAAYFGSAHADEALFDEIVRSFAFAAGVPK